jgi:hypothetical protein
VEVLAAVVIVCGVAVLVAGMTDGTRHGNSDATSDGSDCGISWSGGDGNDTYYWFQWL